MRTRSQARFSENLWLLPALLSAICLTACGDDESEKHMMCDDAGCDSASTHDGGLPVEHDAGVDEGEPDAASPEEQDSGTQPTQDAGGSTPQVDAGTPGVDSGSAPPEQDAGSGDSGSSVVADAGGDAHVSNDAGTTNDAGVTSDSGTTNDAGVTPDAGGSSFVPVRFSASDHGASAFFSGDRWSVENRGEDRGNARSDSAIAPGAGVFYFEAERKIDTVGYYGVGIATANASLTGELGATADSIGMFTSGDFADSNVTCTGFPGFQNPADKHFYGFVIDYRGASPRILYVLDDGAGGVEVRHTCATTITTPVYIFYAGARWEVGYQVRINTGSDTVNLPFHFSANQVKAALTAASETALASAIVFGFGKTRALPLSADPVLMPPGPLTVTAGTNVMLNATASDAEDGNLTGSIQWIDISSQHHAPVVGTGGSFSFVAGLGHHPVIVSVTDSVGRTVSQRVMVNATGSLPHQSQVRMVVDDLSDPSTTLISEPDGLRVDATATEKKGVRGNQGLYGGFWYFEAQRMGVPVNEGVGVMIREGSLNPYDFVNVPWSMSINLTGSTWYNLNSISGWSSTHNHYGFAVDYRGENPIVYVIIGGGGNPTALHDTLLMKDVWTPLYPIVYGNPYYPPDPDPGYDITVNFGADLVGNPFQFDPAAILRAQGINADALVLGWGR